MNEISSYYSDCFSCKYLLIHSFLCMYKILSATLYRAWKLNDYIDVLLHTIYIFYSRHLQAMTNSLSVLHYSIHIFFRIVCFYLISVTHLISRKQFSMCKTAGVWKWNYKEDFFWHYDWYALLMDYSMLQFELIHTLSKSNHSSMLKNTLWIMQVIKSLLLITNSWKFLLMLPFSNANKWIFIKGLLILSSQKILVAKLIFVPIRLKTNIKEIFSSNITEINSQWNRFCNQSDTGTHFAILCGV